MTIKRSFVIAAAIALCAQMASAITADELASQYQAQGYSQISIRTGLSQIKVQAVKDGTKVEMIYDAATGAVLKSESRAYAGTVVADASPRLRNEDRDFTRGGNHSDDDDGDDSHGRGHDDGPDHHSAGHHSGHDSGDDDGDDDSRGRGRGRDDD